MYDSAFHSIKVFKLFMTFSFESVKYDAVVIFYLFYFKKCSQVLGWIKNASVVAIKEPYRAD